MNAFVLLTAISLALAGTSVSSSPSEGEEGAPRDGLKYREQGVSSEVSYLKAAALPLFLLFALKK